MTFERVQISRMERKSLRTSGDAGTDDNQIAVTNERLLRRDLPIKEERLPVPVVGCVARAVPPSVCPYLSVFALGFTSVVSFFAPSSHYPSL